MIRTVPIDHISGFDWHGGVLELSDPAAIRPERLTSIGELPVLATPVHSRVALWPRGNYPYDATVTFPAVTLGSLRAWDRLWVAVEDDPGADLPNQVYLRLIDGDGTQYAYTGGAWTATTTNWTDIATAEAHFQEWSGPTVQLKFRLLTEDPKVTPYLYGYRIGASVDFGRKLQAAGTATHPLASSWMDAALERTILPALAARDFRWWGQAALADGAASLGVARVGETSMAVDAVLAVYAAGADGEGLGAELPGTWDGSDYVFDVPVSGATEAVYEVSFVPTVMRRPAMDVVVKTLPHVLAQNVRADREEPQPTEVGIPDLDAMVMKRWLRRRYRLRMDLRIEAHDPRLCEHIVETIREWLDSERGAVVTCPVTGLQYVVRMDGPPRPGAEIGVPQIVMPIVSFGTPHFEALADAPLVVPDGVTTTTYAGVAVDV